MFDRIACDKNHKDTYWQKFGITILFGFHRVFDITKAKKGVG